MKDYAALNLNILDVGSLSSKTYENITQKNIASVKYIDLNPRDSGIQQEDFLLLESTETFDIICLSL
ncbi:hypothetical protein ROZALSC1DRAFT_27096, partial [Rozella allomycis CSF55]